MSIDGFSMDVCRLSIVVCVRVGVSVSWVCGTLTLYPTFSGASRWDDEVRQPPRDYATHFPAFVAFRFSFSTMISSRAFARVSQRMRSTHWSVTSSSWSSSLRLKSTAAAVADPEVTIEHEAASPTPAESTFDRHKSGTPSPWAVFDAWGASNIHDTSLTPEEERLISNQSVAIPLDENDRKQLPNESDILHAYDKLMQGKSSVHFGYPYNLMFDFTELAQFMKYSINNLGDPFVPSNYGTYRISHKNSHKHSHKHSH